MSQPEKTPPPEAEPTPKTESCKTKCFNVRRCGPHLLADKTRVLLRRLYPSSHDIARRIVNSLLAMSEKEAEEELSSVLDEFEDRHKNASHIYRSRFKEICGNLCQNYECSKVKQTLIGAHFMNEYSPEAAALFNPSIVPHFDQSNLPPGSTRFILSLRATGEGHVSSVAFRVGVVNAHNRVSLEQMPPTIVEPKRQQTATFDKATFVRQLGDSGLELKEDFNQRVISALPEVFTLNHLRDILSREHKKNPCVQADIAARSFSLLAESSYTVTFSIDTDLQQRILFPSSPSQAHGIEDARFVQFTDDNGEKVYYATYTAYDGRICLPQLMETKDFLKFNFQTLQGATQNKGFSLFPRKVNGKYFMISRQDDVNVLIMESESLYKWDSPKVLLEPTYPWEIFKIGNCGSPLETPYGWLLLTHGVGPMRKYCIGAALLDLQDPKKVLARLPCPLISPNEYEREGYVPNVVYTCGSMMHGEEVIIPYAVSDSASSFATCPLKPLLDAMEWTKK